MTNVAPAASFINVTQSKGNEKSSALWTIKELLLLPKFDNSSPSVTKNKEICQSHLIRR